MRATLTFLGTADSKGVPRFWCACRVCQEARETGVNRRTRTALLLQNGEEVALLDAGGDLHAQLARLGRSLVPGSVFLSHAHNDHVLGLADLCREYQPNEVAIEKVFMARNPDSALKLGQARGAAISAVVAPVKPVRAKVLANAATSSSSTPR